jgi:Na+-driven multidrug efflux pump
MSMMGITFNIHALCFFAAHGLSGAASTRVGNDLGAGRPHMAWLTVQVGVRVTEFTRFFERCRGLEVCFFAAHGLSGAASTRVGNDLGARRPHMAWLTVQVGVFCALQVQG